MISGLVTKKHQKYNLRLNVDCQIMRSWESIIVSPTHLKKKKNSYFPLSNQSFFVSSPFLLLQLPCAAVSTAPQPSTPQTCVCQPAAVSSPGHSSSARSISKPTKNSHSTAVCMSRNVSLVERVGFFF